MITPPTATDVHDQWYLTTGGDRSLVLAAIDHYERAALFHQHAYGADCHDGCKVVVPAHVVELVTRLDYLEHQLAISKGAA